MAKDDDNLTYPEREAKRLQDEADQRALERLYGPKHKQASGQWGLGLALLVIGPGFIAWGAASRGDLRLIAVGVVAIAVGLWSFIDGLARARKAKSESRDR